MNKNTIFPNILALIFIAMSFPFFVWVIWHSYHGHQEGTYTTQVLTAVIGIDMAIVSYYFGSSKGSQDKDQTIRAMQQAATPDAPIAIGTIGIEKTDPPPLHQTIT